MSMHKKEARLVSDVREMTGYTEKAALSQKALATALRRAKRHIRIEAGLQSSVDFYHDEYPEREEAVFWFTCLFAKVQTGELDSQSVDVGAVSGNKLLAKQNQDVTTWFRNARNSLRAITGDSYGSYDSARADRDYEYGGSLGSSQGSGSSSDIDVDI